MRHLLSIFLLLAAGREDEVITDERVAANGAYFIVLSRQPAMSS
jgi:hypothetical protein